MFEYKWLYGIFGVEVEDTLNRCARAGWRVIQTDTHHNRNNWADVFYTFLLERRIEGL